MTSHLRLVHDADSAARTPAGRQDSMASASNADVDADVDPKAGPNVDPKAGPDPEAETHPEVAAAALASPSVESAMRLADWIGSGGRELTTRGVLKPAAAVEACDALEIEPPTRRPRSALDLHELMYVWRMALRAGFIERTGRRVVIGAGLRAWRSAEPAEVVRRWIRLAFETTGVVETQEPEEEDPELAGEEALLIVSVLNALYVEGGAAPPGTLVAAVHELTGVGEAGGTGDAGPGSDPLAVPNAYALLMAEDCVDILADFGAADVEEEDGTVRLTALGTALAKTLFVDSAPPGETDAATVVGSMASMPIRIAMTFVRPWLAARPAAERVHELLTVAEQTAGKKRFIALSFARAAGVEGTDAWREWSRRPGFGAYARQWLTRHGIPVEARGGDEEWIATDALAAALAAIPEDLSPEERNALIRELAGDAEETGLFQIMRVSGHPDVPELERLLASAAAATTPSAEAAAALAPTRRASGRGRPADGKPAGRKAADKQAAKGHHGRPDLVAGPRIGFAYRLKITLRGVSKPPVWRRILVLADTPLDELNEVILRVMGWEGYHMHSFSDGEVGYGAPDEDLGFVDERSVLLSEVLTDPGDRLEHTYDFGDGWEHEILLEDSQPADPAMRYPFCVTGKGACPPEDCGGVWGYADLKDALADPSHDRHDELLEWLDLDSPEQFDPQQFSVADANATLEPFQHS